MAATATSTGSANWSTPATWAITGLGTQTAADGVYDKDTETLTPTVSPTWGNLSDRYIDLNGTAYAVVSNNATSAVLTVGPADGTYTYKVCGTPLAGDAVVIATGHTVADNVARIPATSGLLNSLTGVGTGQISLAPTGTNAYELHAATIAQGTGTFIALTGTAAGASLSIVATDIGGGAGTGVCILHSSYSSLNITATNLKGGAGHGLYRSERGNLTITAKITGGVIAAVRQMHWLGTITINGDVEGGTAPAGLGAWYQQVAATTYLNGNLIDSANCVAWCGAPPIRNITSKANYIQSPTVNADGRAAGGQVMRFYLPPQEHEVVAATAGGFEDGANPPGYATAGTRVDCPEAKAVTSSGNYGDPASPLEGTISSSTVDSAGVVTAGQGILDSGGDYYFDGVLETSGVRHAAGVLDVGGAWTVSGVVDSIGTVYAQGVLENAGVNYYTLDSILSTPYANGKTAQLTTDQSTVTGQLARIVAGTNLGTLGNPVGSLALDDILTTGTGAGIGHYVESVRADVLDSASGGTAYSAGVDFHGTYHAPLAAEVLDTVSFGVASAETGTVHLPAVGEVISTASFGAASALTGTYHVCAVAEVLDTVSFGALSAQTGTYHVPLAAEVINSATFGVGNATPGTYDVADVVESNIIVGASIGGVAGTYAATTEYIRIVSGDVVNIR